MNSNYFFVSCFWGEKVSIFRICEKKSTTLIFKQVFLLKTIEKSMKINVFQEKSIEKSEFNFFDTWIMCRYIRMLTFWELIIMYSRVAKIPKNQDSVQKINPKICKNWFQNFQKIDWKRAKIDLKKYSKNRLKKAKIDLKYSRNRFKKLRFSLDSRHEN